MKTTVSSLLFGALLVAGCHKDSPTGPGDSSSLPSPVSAIIGTGGGTLTVKGFSLTVPAAAFSSTETLKVTPQTYDNAFGSRSLSGLFKLEGLPATFAKPLEVKLECSRTPSAGLALAIGRQATDPISGEAQVFYVPIAATKDSAYLKAMLTPDPPAKARAVFRGSARADDLISKVKWLLGVDEQVSMLSLLSNFKIHYPQYLETKAQQLAAILENAYAAYPKMGFDSRAYQLARFPIDVAVARYPSTPASPTGWLLPVTGSGTAVPWLGIAFQEDALVAADVPTLQRAAGQAFCDLFFMVEDKFFWQHPNAQMVQVERNRLWPYYAIGAWAGEVFAPPGPGAPVNFRGQQMCPFEGLPVPVGEKPWAHGLGLAPLMKYFADTYGPAVLTQIYYRVKAEEFGIDAVKKSIPVAETDWLPGFMKEYVAGKIYEVNSDDLLKDLSSPQSSGVFTITGKADTLKKFTATYADLSAKLFRTNLRYPGIDTGAVIRYGVSSASGGSQYIGVMLFGLKDKTLTYWQYGNTVTVKKVKDLTSAGYDIVAAVINCLDASPYLLTRPLDLTVSVEPGAGKPATASFRVKLRGTETSGPTPFTGPGSMSYSSGFRKGTMAGGIFTAVWSETSPDFPSGTLTVNGELTIQLDGTAPPARVIRFSAKETILHSAYSREVWEAASSASCDVPAYWEYNRWVHRVSGTTVRNMVTTAVNRYDSFGDGYWRSFSNPSSDAADLIEIVIE